MTFGQFKSAVVILALLSCASSDSPPTALAGGSSIIKIVTPVKPNDSVSAVNATGDAILPSTQNKNKSQGFSSVPAQKPSEAKAVPSTILMNSDPKKGLISSITKVYVQSPPKAAVFTDSEYTDKGNIRHLTNTRYYFQKVVVSEEDVIKKIDSTLPDSADLEASKNVAPAYNGIINSPSTFQNWEGVSTAIGEQLNLVRTNPRLYATYVEQQLATFIDDKVYQQGMYLSRSVEGKSAWQEAADFLKTQSPVNPLRRVSCLDASTNIMVSDAVQYNIIGYVDKQGRTPFERMKETCKINDGSESIAYGFLSARLAIIQLLVDDSVKDRNHRLTLFKNFTQMGVTAKAFPPDFASIVIIDFLY